MLLAAHAHSSLPQLFYMKSSIKWSLRIHVFLYKLKGDGPFPVVIYNHGVRSGRPRRPEQNEFVGILLTRAGYAVLIPERRGYGDSDGPTLAEASAATWGSGSLHGWRRRPMTCLRQSIIFATAVCRYKRIGIWATRWAA